eukprot:maker-scaffold_9-snap-gene-6.50-mRNA-1 protein AED:0.01 eAED:0.01 QI:97/0.66/0.5/1/1/1/4/0/934
MPRKVVIEFRSKAREIRTQLKKALDNNEASMSTGRRRRSSSSSSSISSGKQEGDTIPVVPSNAPASRIASPSPKRSNATSSTSTEEQLRRMNKLGDPNSEYFKTLQAKTYSNDKGNIQTTVSGSISVSRSDYSTKGRNLFTIGMSTNAKGKLGSPKGSKSMYKSSYFSSGKKHPTSGMKMASSTRKAPDTMNKLTNAALQKLNNLNLNLDITNIGSKGSTSLLAVKNNAKKEKNNFPVKSSKGKPANFNGSWPKLKEVFESDDVSARLEATKNLRNILSLQQNQKSPCFSQDIIDKDIIPLLIAILKTNVGDEPYEQDGENKEKKDTPDLTTVSLNNALQVEALWCLTNIAAFTSNFTGGGSPETASSVGSSETNILIKHNAVPTLVSLLKSNNRDILEQTVWVLGNIAGDDVQARDIVLNAGMLPYLLSWMNSCLDASDEVEQAPGTSYGEFNLSILPNKRNFIKIASWTLSNLCDGQPRPVLDIQAVLNTINLLLNHGSAEHTEEDAEVLSHACWALSHLCDGSSLYIANVVRSNVCVRLVALLSSKHWRVVKPALRTVGNIVCAEDDQEYTQHILDCGAIGHLTKLITHQHKDIQKEACWTISNISAGTIEQIQAVLDSGVIPILVKIANGERIIIDELNKSGEAVDQDVKIEACWVLLNATSCGSDLQIEKLVMLGCVTVLCALLEDASMVMMALEGIEKVMNVGQHLSDLRDCGDLDAKRVLDGYNSEAKKLDTQKLEALQAHRSSAIAKRASRIWKSYFVVCAICSQAYSKYTSQAVFCQECKCYVCANCDCTVFHLSYQKKLWSEMEDGPTKKKNAAAGAAKKINGKTKRQRKRERQKQKKLQKEKEKQEQIATTKTVSAESKQKDVVKKEISKKKNGGTIKNDEYVDYLMQTGSILDLWNMMNENEDTTSIKSTDSQPAANLVVGK